MASTPVPLPTSAELNPGLNPLSPAKLKEIFGDPRSTPLPPHTPGGPCFDVTNRRLDEFIVRRDVGPFKVTGLQPAVDSLADVLAEIKQSNPGLHDRLGTAGMLCVRRIAGSVNTSNHAWGTAVDLRVDGVLNIVGNDMALPELLEIAPVFHRHRWFWGAEFPHEDSMHFEISLEKMQQWQNEGRFTRDPILQHGHVGTKVRELQNLLNRSGVTPPPALAVDGDFGDKTLAAVQAFQAAKQLEVDGVVGIKTWTALRA
jgi:murein L,D-transpeptidase YcbB/YkuD